MKLKNRIIQLCVLTGGVLLFPSCNDFLDREPLDLSLIHISEPTRP